MLIACDSGDSYKIEGELSNLESPTLFVVFVSSESNVVDTVECDEHGQFVLLRAMDDDVREITLYYNERRSSFTVYPELGKPVQVKGDAAYPRLLQIRGGRVNDKLTQFKKKASTLLNELTDIESKTEELPSDEIPRLTNLNHELRHIVQDFVADNPDEIASVILVSEYFTGLDDPMQTEEMLSLLSEKLNDNYYVKILRTETEKAKATVVGARAPLFRVKNIYGETVASDSFANKYFILAFTASWCDMCQTEVLMLDNISAGYSKDSLDILLVSLDDDSRAVRDMLKSDTIRWNLVTDSAGQAIGMFEKFNVSSLPNCFLIDGSGIIRLRTANGAELKNTVEELME